ncbi:MAG: hypothetical protein ACI4V1_01750 [Eubacteriales bacterium]
MKKIRVFDENGKEVNPTYPKRARGLVKQGRARFAEDADDVIVLTSNPEEAYPSDIQEDTEMFEYNGNEERNETAEVSEPMEEIKESGLPLNEELNRLYGILEKVDTMLYNLSVMGPPCFPEVMNDDAAAAAAIAQAVSDGSDSLRHITDRYADMRAQTIQLISKVRDDAKPKWEAPTKAEFDETAYIVEKINMATESYKTVCQYLNDQLRMGRIGLPEYREQMAAVQEENDNRVKELRLALHAE